MDKSDNKTIGDVQFPFDEYVLALPGWYPTWLDPLPGDFNQRHIKAASIYTPQIVLYIGKDQTGSLKETELRVNQPSRNMLEFIVIYPKKKSKAYDSVASNISFLQLLFKYSEMIKNRFGKPKLLHSYIVIRGGLAGWLLGRKWKLPFVLTENWTIYYAADPGYLPKRNRIFQWTVKQVFKHVSMFLPVTNDLAQKVTKLLMHVPSTVVPNVVETNVFNLENTRGRTNTFRFIHISTMIYQKNPEGLLRCFKKLNEKYPATFLQMVGPFSPELKKYANELGLNEDKLHFTGSVSYTEVAQLIKGAQALVLFSRYENLPCVILEALCCGLPVIGTRVGGIAEVINEKNGILLESENEEQLLAAFYQLYQKYSTYDPVSISADATKNYSYASVGKKINEVYKLLNV